MEVKTKRIFVNLWIKAKYVCQESAILFFLIVLAIFACTEETSFSTTKTFAVLEFLVFTAVVIAILAEIIAVLAGIVTAVVKGIKDCKNKNRRKADGEGDRAQIKRKNISKFKEVIDKNKRTLTIIQRMENKKMTIKTEAELAEQEY